MNLQTLLLIGFFVLFTSFNDSLATSRRNVRKISGHEHKLPSNTRSCEMTCQIAVKANGFDCHRYDKKLRGGNLLAS